MKPDYEKAAVAAMNILIGKEDDPDKKPITKTPIDALDILLHWPGVRVMTFSRMATETGKRREELVPLFGENQDAVTFRLEHSIQGVQYVVLYNMFLTVDVVMRGIARELGHIVLGHDGQTRSAEVRLAEAKCFAHHLLSPRPIIWMLKKSNIPVTLDVLAETTGCSSDCAEDMKTIPGVHIPKELNQKVKAQFSQEISEYIRFRSASKKKDTSPVVDFGSFMDYYDE